MKHYSKIFKILNDCPVVTHEVLKYKIEDCLSITDGM